jgi:hypothetical protein
MKDSTPGVARGIGFLSENIDNIQFEAFSMGFQSSASAMDAAWHSP